MAAPEMGWLTLTPGDRTPRGGWQTTIEPGPRLLRHIEERQITLRDIGRKRCGETIVLRRAKAGFWDEGGQIDYVDTDETRQMRDEMAAINHMLASADIVVEDGLGSPTLIDDTDRHLRRIFNNGVFTQGGRLYGGFWQLMDDEARTGRIWIDGEPVVILDYQSMAPRMVYGLQGAIPPQGDIYAIPGIPRELVKGVVTACLADTKPRVSFPRGTCKAMKEGHRIGDVLRSIDEHHPVLYAAFFKGMGLELQFRDSEIMVDVLLQLARRGITALPIHDGIIIAKSDKATGESTLLETFRRHVGGDAVVIEKGGL